MQRSEYVLGHDFTTDKVVLHRGRGVFVEDTSGKKYLDAIGGVGVVNIGHGVPEVLSAIERQAHRLAFAYGHRIDTEPRSALGERIQRWAPRGMGQTRTHFCSGGAEANEAAIKLTVQYHRERGNERKSRFISRWQSYHGNTLGALSLSGRTQWRQDFEVLLCAFPHIQPPYCYRCPYGRSYPACDLACALELERLIRQVGPMNVAGFFAEPIIGTTISAVVPPPEYYPLIRQICNRYDVLLIVDEVMSGFGRTGKRFGIDHWAVSPDIITAGKGISGGYSPLAATILSEPVWKTFAKGSGRVQHSYTYGGNPLSCAVGGAVLDYIEQNSLIQRANDVGEALIHSLQDALMDLPYVGDVRGKGLFIGVELVADRHSKQPFAPDLRVAERVADEALARGLLVLDGVTGNIDGIAGDHFEILPPYTIEDEHCEFIVRTIRESIEAGCKGLRRSSN